MPHNILCPVCNNKNELRSFRWNNYSVTHCNCCNLDFCEEMAEKEVGGDSSPVPKEGIEMMSNSFFKTNKLQDNNHGYGEFMSKRDNRRLDEDELKKLKIQKFKTKKLMKYNFPNGVYDNSIDVGELGVVKDDYTKYVNINNKGNELIYTDYMRAHSNN